MTTFVERFYTYKGVDSRGVARTGRGPIGSLVGFTEGLFTAGWRELKVYADPSMTCLVAAIESRYEDGVRDWWAEG